MKSRAFIYGAVIIVVVGFISLYFISMPVFITEPIFTANPSGNAPLTALVKVNTDKFSRVHISWKSGDIVGEAPVSSGTEHFIPVLGLYPGQNYLLTVTIRGRLGLRTMAKKTFEYETDPIPNDFPPVNVITSKPELMEPGITLFNVFNWTGGLQKDYGRIIGLDKMGEVVWYFQTDDQIVDVKMTPDHTLLYIKAADNFSIVEIDMLGNVLNEWHPSGLNKPVPQGAISVDVDLFHNSVEVLPNGNLLSMATEVRKYDSYPTKEDDLEAPWEPANVVGDVIVEFQRDGTIVNLWKLLDILDPYRIGYGSLAPFYDDRGYENVEGGTKDWSHGNAATYSPQDDSIVVSLRSQDAVVKINRKDKEIRWILGPHENWKAKWQPYLLSPLKDDFQWQYHQHAPMYTGDGTLLLFDNGNFRASPPDEKWPGQIKKYSRVVEYIIDEDIRTVDQAWVYGGPDNIFFSIALSDADWMSNTGNILITDGGKEVAGDRNRFARILEVTHTEPAETVFEVLIQGEDTQWWVYRSERIPSLYRYSDPI